MVESARDVVSDNPVRQVWKYLRSYLSIDYGESEIRRIHGIIDGKLTKNIRKQAEQAGHCIRQAEEYFNASTNVGLATRPLLLYYGAVSLCQALVLLRKDGSNSLDYIRNSSDVANQSRHGLDLNKGLIKEIHPRLETGDLLSKVRCSVDRINGQPRGFFARMYGALSPDPAFCKQVIMQEGGGVPLQRQWIYPHFDLGEINEVFQDSVSVLDCIDTMPDMYWSLKNLGMETFLFRCQVLSTRTEYSLRDGDSDEVGIRSNVFDIHVNGIDADSRNTLVEDVINGDSRFEKVAELHDHIHFRMKFHFDAGNAEDPIALPMVLSSLHGEQFLVKPGYGYSSDVVTMFIALYCLGMLARYFPDKWMPVIDGNVIVAELIDTLLNVVYRKFPNLILDQMSEVKHHIHV